MTETQAFLCLRISASPQSRQQQIDAAGFKFNLGALFWVVLEVKHDHITCSEDQQHQT